MEKSEEQEPKKDEEAEEELLKRCMIDMKDQENLEDIQSLMQEIAPLITADLISHCPECGHDIV